MRNRCDRCETNVESAVPYKGYFVCAQCADILGVEH